MNAPSRAAAVAATNGLLMNPDDARTRDALTPDPTGRIVEVGGAATGGDLCTVISD